MISMANSKTLIHINSDEISVFIFIFNLFSFNVLLLLKTCDELKTHNRHYNLHMFLEIHHLLR